jgi:hypothetical protein
MKYGVQKFCFLAKGGHFNLSIEWSGSGALFGLFWYLLDSITGNPGPIHSRIRKLMIQYPGAVVRK